MSAEAPPRRVALLVPVTSSGRRYADCEQIDLIRLLLPSLLETATWDGRWAYELHVGYDAGDPFFDRPGRPDELAGAFAERVGARPLTIDAHRCEGTKGAPCWVWNALFARAHARGCELFYQLGDDVVLETPGWTPAFAAALAANPACPGLGVTGPVDDNNARLLTQSFVSRLHMEVFGSYYPPLFRNWWSDNWLMQAYAPRHRFSTAHRVRNAGGRRRYPVQREARTQLAAEVQRGRETIAAWLAARGTGAAV